MESTGEVWKLGHRPALDGLRGIAVLLVIACHSFYGPIEALGSVGVTVFFTLSGFLITRILLEQREHHGEVPFGAFYLRRALRLLPAMLVMVTTVAGVHCVAGFPMDWRALALVYAYLGNLPDVTASGMWLSHTWSLAVEEQFYVVWPVVLVAVLRRWDHRVLGWVAGTGVAGSAVLRLAWWDGGAGDSVVYLSTLTRADALLVGCLLAIVVPRLVAAWRVPVAGVVAACAGLLLLGLTSGVGYFLAVPTVAPWLTAVLILAVLQGTDRGWTWGPLRLAGQRSYGLYLWHLPTASVVAMLGGVGWVGIVTGWVATWGLAALSWRFVEQPFLRLSAGPPATLAASPTPVVPALSRVAALR